MSRICNDWAWNLQLKSSLKLTILCLSDHADNTGFLCYPSIKRIAHNTGLNVKTVQKCINELIKIGLVSDTGKRCGQSNQVRVLKLHPRQDQKRDDPKNGNIPNLPLDDPKNGIIDDPKNGIRNQSSNQSSNQSDIGDKKTKSKKFVKPTFDDVYQYCKERGNRIDPNRFIDHYESVGWMVGRNKMKCWQACVRTWEKNQINQQPSTAPKQNGFDKGFEI